MDHKGSVWIMLLAVALVAIGVGIFYFSHYVSAACTITSFSADPLTVLPGGTSTIAWNTRNCIGGNLSGNDGVNLDIKLGESLAGDVGPSGTVVFGPINRDTYINLWAFAFRPPCPSGGCPDSVGKEDSKQILIKIVK